MSWVESELKGYKSGTTLPSYRLIEGIAAGHIPGYTPMNPLQYQDPRVGELLEIISKRGINSPVGVIEQQLKQEGKFYLPVPASQANLLSDIMSFSPGMKLAVIVERGTMAGILD